MDDIVIKVDKVYKDFVLPHENQGSVKGIFTGMFSKATSSKEKQHALKDISFEVKKGEFFGIVGRNGSGKSTLLKILAGIYQPTAGNISTYGKLVPFIELGVGFNPELTGRDNVYLNGAMLGFSAKEVDAMYDEIVAFAELERFMDQKLKNYSSGMQVRLAFSMAVRSEADILLIDEVLAVGDADFQRKCFKYFKKLKKDNKTVVFVSHDMEAVREYCDRAMLIENNEMLIIGKTSAVASAYMKLFNEHSEAQSSTGNRWGNNSLTTLKVEVKEKAEKLIVEQTIQANKDSKEYITGFRIKDGSGVEILGTNSKIERQRMPDLKKGQETVVLWEFPNVLADGEYLIEPAILLADAITVADWWDEANSFTIKKSRHLPYSIDPGYKVSNRGV